MLFDRATRYRVVVLTSFRTGLIENRQLEIGNVVTGPSRPANLRTCLLRALIYLPALHNEPNVLEHADVVEWITGYGHQVS